MIRTAAHPDLGAMTRLHAECFVEAWSAESLGRLLTAPGAFALLAEVKGRAAGFVLVRTAAGEAEILTIAVSPTHRRTGLGRALVEKAALRAAADGATALFLEVSVANDAARALYTASGFGEAGLRKGYYAAVGGTPALDALILRRDLPESGPLGNAARLD
jgi:ribosomal-protein-alanine N-acetyltransferase